MGNYLDAIVAALDEKLPGHRPELLRFYALLVLTTGIDTTLENVHDAWSAWQTATRPEHRSLIPFNELTLEVRELDRPYMEAIVSVASDL